MPGTATSSLTRQVDMSTVSVGELSDVDHKDVDREDLSVTAPAGRGTLAYWSLKVEGFWALEVRGITRFSIKLQSINIIIGVLGPLVYGLGWIDCICMIIFSNALNSAAVAYLATLGPVGGNRTMIVGRYFVDHWLSKIACILNVVQQVGFGTIWCIITGQMITAVNGGSLSLAVGCVNDASYVYIPQMIAIFVLIVSARKKFDAHEISVGGDTIFASIIGVSVISTDSYTGIWTALVLTKITDIGIATEVPNVPEWNDAWPTKNQSRISISSLESQYGSIPAWSIPVLYVACRNDLYTVFENFLPLNAIVVEEHYTGPVALLVGSYGGDIDAWLAIAFASVTYPPLRYPELKNFGR
ncbi:hypothetical protein BJ878DRAFT_536432 [Calycina marina]|uniref:Uncharacterized protein n=1 Tax=Calycina marina TaxID=1763456 RepID=A0A9P8CCG8_9HELO|nr:hypothetical protein BJ878DRAFT_536432 [Calycina marina]